MRFGSVLLSCVLATAGLAAAAPAPATAALLDTLTCVGTSHTKYEPPISDEEANTTRTIHQNYGPCTGTGEGNGIISGIHESTNQTRRSCLQLLSSGTVSWTITWNNGETSTLDANRVSNLAALVFTNTFTGTITSGRLAGHSFIETMTAPSTDITLCTAGDGTVSDLYSVHTLTVI